MAEGKKYKHRVINSEPPQDHALTPAEMGAPFFPMMEETTKKKNEERAKKGEKPVDLDAFPIFRADPKNPARSIFNMLPMDIVKRTKIKRKDKDGKETQTELFEKR